MANGKEIKRRIKSIKNTGKITKAMELISTVKMKKAQDLALEKKSYMRSILEVFLGISDSLSESKFFSKQNIGGKTLGIIITSNKGLCGGYNINVMKKVSQYMKENTDETIDFIAVGKRGSQFVGRTGNTIVADFSHDFSDNIDLYFAKSISRLIQEKFLSPEYSKIVVFYNHYINTIKQVPVAREFLPLTKVGIEMYFKQVFGEDFYDEKVQTRNEVKKTDYTIEPSKAEVLNELLPMLIDSMFYDMLIEAKASEHSSRMIAMKNAKDNANKYASKLTLAYNKARQAAITKEVSEIVSGVESMKE
ncbi:MAG: ATP synthase F1 subunit gamma [Candidatus Gracilibacteria bacterium]|nr:ATP synthase F1 subunit gamma [Candidatus Gracilibacteria bacterium]